MDEVNTVSALLAYTTAVLQDRNNDGLDIRSVKNALAPKVLQVMVGMPELPQAYNQLQILKIVYYRLALEHDLAIHLPFPDIKALSSLDPPNSEFIKLYSIILVQQTVWSEENSRFVRVIQGLEQKHQECLKVVIEDALAGLPEESPEEALPDKGMDDSLRRADLFCKAQRRSAALQAKLAEAMQQGETARHTLTEAAYKPSGLRDSSSLRRGVPDKTLGEDSNFTLGDSDTESESNGDLKHTSHDDSRVPSSVYRGTAKERMRELEVERLQADLDEKADELRQLEIQLEELRQTVQAYASRIAELEAAVEEVGHLRDEAEVHRHSAEKLKKSENVVDKLKKKLESTSGMRSELQDMQKQVQILRDENSEWENRYTTMMRERKTNATSRIFDQELVSETQMTALSARLQQLELDTHAKEAEIKRLEAILFASSRRGSERSGKSLLHDYGETSPTKTTEGEMQVSPVSDRLLSPTLMREFDTSQADTEIKSGTYDRLHRRILELEALLAKVSRSARSTSDGSMTLPGPEAISRQTADNGRPHFELEAGADNETLRLKVQEATADAEMRYRTEKLLMLKAWTDLGQRAMKLGGNPDGTGSAASGSGGQLLELSWANRMRRQMHTMDRLVEPSKQQA
ncbi:hypothetical protein NliqN6_5639 [Naganishia liquefaciens]|uniref:Hook C-terminal domain-containing protein n=1 Tax=Naganishia liquefaciens TaxID=104408 RepID=A0A8H3TY49_9TREE|nr:hypothetical protein NliqN6_5639 [Naganishia liquefaciens]